MNKAIKILLATILATAMIAMVGCGIFDSTASIKITKLPKTTFEVNEELDPTTVELQLDGGQTYTYADAQKLGVSLTGFDTSKVGSYTASFNYQGYSAAFNYTVVAQTPVFAGGDGTAENPYLIATAEQFMNIRSGSRNYYKLIADIDLADQEATYDTRAEAHSYVSTITNKTIDGNGKKIYNVGKDDGKYRYLFSQLNISSVGRGVTLKNLDVYIVGQTTLVRETAHSNYDAAVENVRVFGTVVNPENNYAPFTSYIKGNASGSYKGSVVFKNCENHVNIIGGYKSSGFVAINYTDMVSSVKFTNCKNYGVIEGVHSGVFYANGLGSNTKITTENCINYGKVVGISYAGYVNVSNNGTCTESVKGQFESQNGGCVEVLGTPDEMKATFVGEQKQLEITVDNTKIDKILVAVLIPVTMENGTNRLTVLVEADKEVAESTIKDIAIYGNIFEQSNTILTGESVYSIDNSSALLSVAANKFYSEKYTLSTVEAPYVYVLAYSNNVLVGGLTLSFPKA